MLLTDSTTTKDDTGLFGLGNDKMADCSAYTGTEGVPLTERPTSKAGM